jgi:hypothetical protein
LSAAALAPPPASRLSAWRRFTACGRSMNSSFQKLYAMLKSTIRAGRIAVGLRKFTPD